MLVYWAPYPAVWVLVLRGGSPHPGVQMGISELFWGLGSRNAPSHFMLWKPGVSTSLMDYLVKIRTLIYQKHVLFLYQYSTFFIFQDKMAKKKAPLEDSNRGSQEHVSARYKEMNLKGLLTNLATLRHTPVVCC